MATEPLRLRILKAMQAALEEITPANGYASDLTGAVFRGRNVFGDTDPIPLVSILEAPDPINPLASPKDSGDQKGNWAMLIQGFVEDDPFNPTDPAHVLMADVKKRLVQERVRDRQRNILGMGGSLTDLKISPGVVRPADDISAKAYFWLRVTLTMVENLQDPYL